MSKIIIDGAYSCGYCECIYSEWDTGYKEYGCTLGDNNPEENPCREEDCPLICSYEVEKCEDTVN